MGDDIRAQQPWERAAHAAQPFFHLPEPGNHTCTIEGLHQNHQTICREKKGEEQL
jgi:hypothetical protein